MRETTEASEQSSATATSSEGANNNQRCPTGSTPAPVKRSDEELLRFDLLRCALYHEDCEAWFARLGRLVTGCNLLLSSAAVITLTNSHPKLAIASSLAIALLSVISLVWDYTGRAKDHRGLRQRYYLILSELEGGAIDLAKIRSSMTGVYAEEPPANEGANCIAHNRAGTMLWGEDFNRAPVSWLRRRCRHLVG